MYFTDLGLRNYALGQYGASLTLQDVGFLFQNLIYHILKTALRYSGARIHFWRTKDQAEIDFVVTRGSIITPFEVKYTTLKLPTGIFIFNDHVMTIVWKEKPTAFIIKSKNNYERYKEFFEEVWKTATP